jgi:hypothetical protein
MKKIRFKLKNMVRVTLSGVSLCIFSLVTFGQGADYSIGIKGCFHDLTLERGQRHTIMSGDELRFEIVGSTHPDWALVETFDVNGNPLIFDYRESGLASLRNFYDFYHDPIGKQIVWLYREIDNVGYSNGNWFKFNSDVKTVKFTFYRLVDEDTKEEGIMYLEILSPEDAFSIENNGTESCFSFDNFNPMWNSVKSMDYAATKFPVYLLLLSHSIMYLHLRIP